MSLFEELCRCAGFEHIEVRVSRCGYVVVTYRGLEFYEWLLNPYQIVEVDDEWNEEQQEA